MIDTIFQAIRDNDFSLVKKTMIENSHLNVNSQDYYGNSLLHTAIFSQNIDITKFLINNGANVNILNNLNTTPLMLTISLFMDKSTQINIIELLLDNGANINYSNQLGDTALIESSYFNADIMRILLNAGADFNHKNNLGITALQGAVFNQQIECVKLLLSCPNIDIDTKNYKNESVFDIIKTRDNSEILNLLNTYKNYIELENQSSVSNNNTLKKQKI